jgi:hypothetical protein
MRIIANAFVALSILALVDQYQVQYPPGILLALLAIFGFLNAAQKQESTR